MNGLIIVSVVAGFMEQSLRGRMFSQPRRIRSQIFVRQRLIKVMDGRIQSDDGSLAGTLIKSDTHCLRRARSAAGASALRSAEDGMAGDQHLGAFLARPACVHLLHCSKKHFPFSVVSLTQKKNIL